MASAYCPSCNRLLPIAPTGAKLPAKIRGNSRAALYALPLHSPIDPSGTHCRFWESIAHAVDPPNNCPRGWSE